MASPTFPVFPPPYNHWIPIPRKHPKQLSFLQDGLIFPFYDFALDHWNRLVDKNEIAVRIGSEADFRFYWSPELNFLSRFQASLALPKSDRNAVWSELNASFEKVEFRSPLIQALQPLHSFDLIYAKLNILLLLGLECQLQEGESCTFVIPCGSKTVSLYVPLDIPEALALCKKLTPFTPLTSLTAASSLKAILVPHYQIWEKTALTLLSHPKLYSLGFRLLAAKLALKGLETRAEIPLTYLLDWLAEEDDRSACVKAIQSILPADVEYGAASPTETALSLIRKKMGNPTMALQLWARYLPNSQEASYPQYLEVAKTLFTRLHRPDERALGIRIVREKQLEAKAALHLLKDFSIEAAQIIEEIAMWHVNEEQTEEFAEVFYRFAAMISGFEGLKLLHNALKQRWISAKDPKLSVHLRPLIQSLLQPDTISQGVVFWHIFEKLGVWKHDRKLIKTMLQACLDYKKDASAISLLPFLFEEYVTVADWQKIEQLVIKYLKILLIRGDVAKIQVVLKNHPPNVSASFRFHSSCARLETAQDETVRVELYKKLTPYSEDSIAYVRQIGLMALKRLVEQKKSPLALSLAGHLIQQQRINFDLLYQLAATLELSDRPPIVILLKTLIGQIDSDEERLLPILQKCPFPSLKESLRSVQRDLFQRWKRKGELILVLIQILEPSKIYPKQPECWIESLTQVETAEDAVRGANLFLDLPIGRCEQVIPLVFSLAGRVVPNVGLSMICKLESLFPEMVPDITQEAILRNYFAYSKLESLLRLLLQSKSNVEELLLNLKTTPSLAILEKIWAYCKINPFKDERIWHWFLEAVKVAKKTALKLEVIRLQTLPSVRCWLELLAIMHQVQDRECSTRLFSLNESLIALFREARVEERIVLIRHLVRMGFEITPLPEMRLGQLRLMLFELEGNVATLESSLPFIQHYSRQNVPALFQLSLKMLLDLPATAMASLVPPLLNLVDNLHAVDAQIPEQRVSLPVQELANRVLPLDSSNRLYFNQVEQLLPDKSTALLFFQKSIQKLDNLRDKKLQVRLIASHKEQMVRQLCSFLEEEAGSPIFWKGLGELKTVSSFPGVGGLLGNATHKALIAAAAPQLVVKREEALLLLDLFEYYLEHCRQLDLTFCNLYATLNSRFYINYSEYELFIGHHHYFFKQMLRSARTSAPSLLFLVSKLCDVLVKNADQWQIDQHEVIVDNFKMLFVHQEVPADSVLTEYLKFLFNLRFAIASSLSTHLEKNCEIFKIAIRRGVFKNCPEVYRAIYLFLYKTLPKTQMDPQNLLEALHLLNDYASTSSSSLVHVRIFTLWHHIGRFRLIELPQVSTGLLRCLSYVESQQNLSLIDFENYLATLGCLLLDPAQGIVRDLLKAGMTDAGKICAKAFHTLVQMIHNLQSSSEDKERQKKRLVQLVMVVFKEDPSFEASDTLDALHAIQEMIFEIERSNPESIPCFMLFRTLLSEKIPYQKMEQERLTTINHFLRHYLTLSKNRERMPLIRVFLAGSQPRLKALFEGHNGLLDEMRSLCQQIAGVVE